MRLTIGVIIAIVLIFVWWKQDHPGDGPPIKQGYLTVFQANV